MARVSLVEKGQAHPRIKESFEKGEAQGWQAVNISKVMAHCPYIGLNFTRLGNSILRGEELPATMRELAILRVGNLTKAKYEFTHHTRLGLQAGLSQKQIDDISHWSASSEYSDQERAVLAYTDEVTQRIRVKDKTFAKLRSFLSEHSIVELTAAIAYYNGVCRILEALEVELEPHS